MLVMKINNLKKYPFYYQANSMDCGLACLRMIASYYGKSISIEHLRKISDFEKTGASMFGLSKAATSLNLDVTGVLVDLEDLTKIVNDIPVIIHWKGNHFIVLYAIKNGKFIVADPGKGMLKLAKEEFEAYALYSDAEGKKVANVLILEVTKSFLSLPNDKINNKKHIDFLISYIKDFRLYFLFIIWALLLGLTIQMLLPLFTKNVVDDGVQSKSIKYVFYLLSGQLILILSGTIFSITRSWVTVHLSSRINFSLVSKFIVKLFKVPLSFFETRKIGDILQRIGDHSRVEMFITRVSLSSLFSALTIVFYSIILAYYQIGFFLIIFVSMILYAIWALLFLNKRKEIDWRRFELSSKNQSNIIQIVNGIHDLKINNCEKRYYEKWRLNQNEIINNGFESLKLSQYQDTGATLIMQMAQICITFLSVKLVIDGDITFGVMLSIQFIIGQLIIPIQQIMSAVGSAQDARLSFDRLVDVWDVKNEDEYQRSNQRLISEFQNDASIVFNNVVFNYPGQDASFSLNNISFDLEEGKTTAIVGLSGSGKTSIIKLLLGYYSEYKGAIRIGDLNLKDIDLTAWRERCGVVMQESYLFNESIAENVAMTSKPDLSRLQEALEIANMWSFVNSLPLGYNTVVGVEGKGLSQGQKQRLLIARAVYKNPEYLFFDEATNSLDAQNEDLIMRNLKKVFIGKTVLIVAHRLSTIQFADKILLLENGKIMEYGTHLELSKNNGRYRELVDKQMFK